MKFLSVCLAIAVSVNVSGQFKKVDRDKIEQEVSDTTSAFFYPKLLEKLNSNTELSNEEYRALYYGFVFQQEYSGYADHGKALINDAINKQQYGEAVQIADAILGKIPVSLTAHYLKGYAIFKLDSTDVRWRESRSKYLGLRDAILSSGDGLTCETAFKTIFVSDEYDIMSRYFEITNRHSQSLVYPCDKFNIDAWEYFRATEIFFDTSETMLAFEKMNNPGNNNKGKRKKKK